MSKQDAVGRQRENGRSASGDTPWREVFLLCLLTLFCAEHLPRPCKNRCGRKVRDVAGRPEMWPEGRGCARLARKEGHGPRILLTFSLRDFGDSGSRPLTSAGPIPGGRDLMPHPPHATTAARSWARDSGTVLKPSLRAGAGHTTPTTPNPRLRRWRRRAPSPPPSRHHSNAGAGGAAPPSPPQAISRPAAAAKGTNPSMRLSNSWKLRVWSPSDMACSGSGCTSTRSPSAPAATAA